MNNTFKLINYTVETDLEQISGIPQFEVQGFSNYQYQFQVLPLAGGIYTG